MRFWNRRAETPRNDLASVADALHPAITRERHALAAQRLAAERAKVVMLRYPNGQETPFHTGTLQYADLVAETGYTVTLAGYDRFGWPKGAPESPASPG